MTHHETHGKNCICHSCEPTAPIDKELARIVAVGAVAEAKLAAKVQPRGPQR